MEASGLKGSCWFSPFFVGLKFSTALLLLYVRRGEISFLVEIIYPCPEHTPHYFSPADLKTAGYGV